MPTNYTFIVVGGGIAGVSCVEALLTWLPSETVLLLSSTTTIKTSTNAVSISKTLVQFDVEEQPTDSFSKKYPGLDIVIDTVTGVDTDAHTVTTASGVSFGYVKLCLCLGGRPNLIVQNNPYVLGIRDTDSVARLSNALLAARRVVICGNGGIASELIYEMKGVEKIWLVKDRHISSVFLDPGAAEFVRDCLTSDKPAAVTRRCRYTGESSSAALGPDWLVHNTLHGALNQDKLVIEYGASITAVKENEPMSEYPVRIELDNGKIFHADLIISATGVIPNGDTIAVVPKRLTYAADGGIFVDDKLGTSAADVLAAGDVATHGWTAAPHWQQMRLWTQARQMGQYAGRVMSAQLNNQAILQDFCFEIFSHVTKFYGLRVILLGLFNAQTLEGNCEYLVRVTPGKEYVKLVLQNGKIQGAVLIGDTDLEEMCENLILDQIDVSFLGEQLLDPDVDIDDYFD